MTSLGPFIGHATASTVIIWGRRGLPAEDLAFDATTQVSISMKKKDEESSSSSTFTAKRADDNVFRFALEGLEAKTHYVATVTGFFDEVIWFIFNEGSFSYSRSRTYIVEQDDWLLFI